MKFLKAVLICQNKKRPQGDGPGYLCNFRKLEISTETTVTSLI